MSYKQALQENNVDLQALLDAVNELPDQVSLPTLSNPASPAEILSGYEAIGADGSKIVGEMEKGLQLSVVSHTRTSSSSTRSASFTVSGTIKHVGVSCAVSSTLGSSRKFLDAFAVASGLQSYSTDTDYSGTVVNTDAKLTWTGGKLNVTTMNLGYNSVYTFYIFYE